ncbi:MAG TPA: hypothetical protein VGQ34_13040 [Sphingomicrobium sp.]|jgi:hypothetical protein|nr:hypothetical protein [Sphingomicrobium sp.]
MHRHALGLFLGSAILVWFSADPLPVPGFCKAALIDRAPDRYQPLGDRCEGIYGQNSSGEAQLVLRSFGEKHSDRAQMSPLTISWPEHQPRPLSIVVENLGQTKYRLDTVVGSPAAERFQWDGGILSRSRIDISTLYVRAFSAKQLKGTNRDVFVPVRLNSNAGKWESEYQIVVSTGTRVNDLRLTQSAIEVGNGADEKVLLDDIGVGIGTYSTIRPIVANFSMPAAGVVYHLTLKGVDDANGSIKWEGYVSR